LEKETLKIIKSMKNKNLKKALEEEQEWYEIMNQDGLGCYQVKWVRKKEKIKWKDQKIKIFFE
jgi:hypothetical protein